MISLMEALAVVAASKDHKIIERLPKLDTKIPEGMETRQGLYVDVETTGLDTNLDEVIEFGGIPFKFTLDGKFIQPLNTLHFYNEPRKSISKEITDITHITPDMVAGQVLDIRIIETVLDSTDIVIAHNAAFDRPMLERVSSKFAEKYWGCSMEQVPWKGGKKLEYILNNLGYFYDAHNAVSDCEAGLFAIAQGENLAHILEASRNATWHVWAVGAAFEVKDILKDRKYYWNPDKKVWHKDNIEDADLEEEWLNRNVYKRGGNAKFVRVTGKERFSNRG